MKKSMFPFGLFLGFVLSAIAGGYKYGVFPFVLFAVSFSCIVVFAYRVYLLLERFGLFIYEKFFKERIAGYKKAREIIKKQE